MGIKVKELERPNGEHGGWLIECPGCGCGHMFDARWKFNGNLEEPTFTPSMLVNKDRQKDNDGVPAVRCHSFVTNGYIKFLSDCDHELANQTVEIPDY